MQKSNTTDPVWHIKYHADTCTLVFHTRHVQGMIPRHIDDDEAWRSIIWFVTGSWICVSRTLLPLWTNANMVNERLASGERDEDPPTNSRYISWLLPIRTGPAWSNDAAIHWSFPAWWWWWCDGSIITIDCVEVCSEGRTTTNRQSLKSIYT